jgi:membrane protease subunit HflK
MERHCFCLPLVPITGAMRRIGSVLTQAGLAMTGKRSPWGKPQPEDTGHNDGENRGGADNPPSSEGDPPKGPRNPWLPGGNEQPRRSASIEDIFRGRGPSGGPGGGGRFPRLPQRPDGRSWFPLIVGGIGLLWLAVSTVHMVGPKEEGIITTFGKYSRTIGPGVSLSMPWPIQSVAISDVTSIKVDTIPEGETEKLMLTSDQNLVDTSYLVRWNIKDLKLYNFRLADPEETVRQVAEASMRASIAEVTLNQALSGAGRGTVEQNVKDRMQRLLDKYRSGVRIQGVEIKKADPPRDTLAAFQQVTSAQQDAERDRSNARAWAQQLLARAQGDAAAFDKVYAEYKLAPEVTKRRMYYETMERVLNKNPKVIMEAQGVSPFLPLPEMKKRIEALPAPTTKGGQ